ncbi:MAG: class II aldolase/adducin family protein [Candidatus Omnitrophica bacterium]|nr:class II aldolase/adducin family protein [Candidatus Omnitrophota bacterium]
MQRCNIKRKLAECAKELAKEGLVSAASGNISAKDGKIIYIKKSGTSFKKAKAQYFVDINNTALASIEHKLHKACYKARPGIKAVVHTHPVSILTLSSLGVKLKAVTIDFAIYFKNGINIIKYAAPGSGQLALLTKKAIKNKNAVILKNHGLVTIGKTIEEAMMRSIIAEREAKLILASILLKRNIKYLTRKQLMSIYKI